MIRFGVHCSLRDGLRNSLFEAAAKGCESMQIFTKSPRIWRMREPDQSEIVIFRSLRKKLGIHPLVIHTPYLPNLATSKSELYEKSKAALLDDIRVSDLLGADYLVIHPGSFSEGSSIGAGVQKAADAISDCLFKMKPGVMLLIENTAGGGRRLGSNFVEIGDLLDKVRSSNIGLCLDTAHAMGAGYDFSSLKGIDKAFSEIEQSIGLEKLEMIHFNDSMVPCGSRKDRHQHLGKGFIGIKGFQHIVKLSLKIAKAGILETPKEPLNSDKKNLKILFELRNNIIKFKGKNAQN